MERLQKVLAEAAAPKTIASALDDYLKEAGTLAIKNIHAHLEEIKPAYGSIGGLHFKGYSRGDIEFSCFAAIYPKGGSEMELSMTVSYGMWSGDKEAMESIGLHDKIDKVVKLFEKHLTF